MNSRKRNQLKRNPFIRLIRSIFRLIRVAFRPKRSIPIAPIALIDRIAPIAPITIEEIHFDRDRLITVGELLGRVKWQSSPAEIPAKVLDPSVNTRIHDVSRN